MPEIAKSSKVKLRCGSLCSFSGSFMLGILITILLSRVQRSTRCDFCGICCSKFVFISWPTISLRCQQFWKSKLLFCPLVFTTIEKIALLLCLKAGLISWRFSSNVCLIKIHSKHSSVLLLCLLQIFMRQTLFFFGFVNPKVTVHKCAETIQGRKLSKGENYMRKYVIYNQLIIQELQSTKNWLKLKYFHLTLWSKTPQVKILQKNNKVWKRRR